MAVISHFWGDSTTELSFYWMLGSHFCEGIAHMRSLRGTRRSVHNSMISHCRVQRTQRSTNAKYSALTNESYKGILPRWKREQSVFHEMYCCWTNSWWQQLNARDECHVTAISLCIYSILKSLVAVILHTQQQLVIPYTIGCCIKHHHRYRSNFALR